MRDTSDQAHREALGPAWIGEPALAELVRESWQRPPLTLTEWSVEPIGYESGTPSTGLLLRVRGTAADAAGPVRWSFVVKQLQSLRHWPLLHRMAAELPKDVLDEQLERFPWRIEADIYSSDIDLLMPSGLRLPRVHRIDDLGDERVVLWMEDVQSVDVPWVCSRFERAAYLLGRLAARRSEARLPADARTPPTAALRYFLNGQTAYLLPKLDDDVMWTHPLITESTDGRLRADLRSMAARIPAILETLDRLPQTLPHGDASPQNLLVPADGSADFVAIDWGAFSTLLPVGFDLGQLLIGLAHAGGHDPGELPALQTPIALAYAAGLREDGMIVDDAEVEYGFVASLVLRSGLGAIPFERLDSAPGPELVRLFDQRARLARFLVDLGLAL